MLGHKLCSGTFKTKIKLDWTGMSSFVLEVPLHYLHPSIVNSAPCGLLTICED